VIVAVVGQARFQEDSLRLRMRLFSVWRLFRLSSSAARHLLPSASFARG